MKKITAVFFAFIFILSLSSPAHADLNSFLKSLNVQAEADIDEYGVRISAQFGVPLPEVRDVIKKVDQPADAFMVFQLGKMAAKPSDKVLQTYKADKHKGWGEMAKELGIKPGSKEFHALKRGDLRLDGGSGSGGGQGVASSPGKGHGGGKGHGKGHNK